MEKELKLTQFPNLPGKHSYGEAQAFLMNHFSILKNEKVDIFYSTIFPKDRKARLIATNWALRIFFEKKSKKNCNFVIPYKTIVKIRKYGGKHHSKSSYGIKLKLASCARLIIPFPINQPHRGIFLKRMQKLMQKPLQFNAEQWVPDQTWIKRILQNNSTFRLMKNNFCDTYPDYILMPIAAKKQLVIDCAKYRSRSRVPLLSYVFPDNKAPLLRSSQPLTGFRNSESKDDQELLNILCDHHNLSIIDCRPKINAIANQFTGGGYESMEHYENATFVFLDIPNIHRVRDCFNEMINGVMNDVDHSWDAWGELTFQLIDGGTKSLNELRNNRAVLVHCTDGWDRTAQISALTQIIADPWCRTIDGFIQLIQRDWIDYGHRFSLRCSHLPVEKSSEVSPIFAQFIDAVGQLLYKQPKAFEYNIRFLAAILANAYSQLYGDFLGSTYQSRLKMKRPPSFFQCIQDPEFRSMITNQEYQEANEINTKLKKYRFIPKIFGSPVFFTEDTPLYSSEPPIVSFELSELGINIPQTSTNDNSQNQPTQDKSELNSSSSGESQEKPEKPKKKDKKEKKEKEDTEGKKEKERKKDAKKEKPEKKKKDEKKEENKDETNEVDKEETKPKKKDKKGKKETEDKPDDNKQDAPNNDKPEPQETNIIEKSVDTVEENKADNKSESSAESSQDSSSLESDSEEESSSYSESSSSPDSD